MGFKTQNTHFRGFFHPWSRARKPSPKAAGCGNTYWCFTYRVRVESAEVAFVVDWQSFQKICLKIQNTKKEGGEERKRDILVAVCLVLIPKEVDQVFKWNDCRNWWMLPGPGFNIWLVKSPKFSNLVRGLLINYLLAYKWLKWGVCPTGKIGTAQIQTPLV